MRRFQVAGVLWLAALTSAPAQDPPPEPDTPEVAREKSMEAVRAYVGQVKEGKAKEATETYWSGHGFALRVFGQDFVKLTPEAKERTAQALLAFLCRPLDNQKVVDMLAQSTYDRFEVQEDERITRSYVIQVSVIPAGADASARAPEFMWLQKDPDGSYRITDKARLKKDRTLSSQLGKDWADRSSKDLTPAQFLELKLKASGG